MPIKIETLTALKDNYIYALVADGRCAVIDPGESGPIEAFLMREGLKLTHILCTHHHWDHVDGIVPLVEQFGCEVWGSEYDRNRIPKQTRSLHEGAEYELFGQPLKILEVPGHTLGQIAYWLTDAKALFVGDTLFSAGCGRLFEGSMEQMFTSLEKIKSLPPETMIYFGHEYTLRNIEFVLSQPGAPKAEIEEYRRACESALSRGEPTTPSVLATELKINPFLYAQSVKEFRRWREARDSW